MNLTPETREKLHLAKQMRAEGMPWPKISYFLLCSEHTLRTYLDPAFAGKARARHQRNRHNATGRPIKYKGDKLLERLRAGMR